MSALNTKEYSPLKSFFSANTKTIQKNFRFEVIIDSYPEIKPWHVLKVSFPVSYGFKLENMKIGPYSYGIPLMDHTGFDIDITLEEDDKGTIFDFIFDVQDRIIGSGSSANGNYNPQTSNRIPSIKINMYKDDGEILRSYTFTNCFFMKADSLSLDYEGNDSVKYMVSFHSDLLSVQ
jgi:hypothetical protein